MFAAQYKHGKADLRDESYCFADGCGDLYLCAHTATAARYAAGCCIEVGTDRVGAFVWSVVRRRTAC